MGKYYAVRKGRRPGIYESWLCCEPEVKGYPGAVYKSFPTKAEAEAFMNNTPGAHVLSSVNPDGAIAYVDGSYDSPTGRYSFGIVLIHSGNTETFCQCFSKNDWSSMRNVAGELMGAITAIKLAMDRNQASLLICHDYLGISEWANGNWKANQPGTRAYQEFLHSVADHISVQFRHVKGHTGVEYNEMADRLAALAMTDKKFLVLNRGCSV